ncbi:GAF domain-containing protein [Herpetosiphon sp.]|uniref:Anti-sigma-factor antagonist n=1 Tax=Herpetosiphon aurantiacus (strain ATCC 23779 / DSM 785 / 114-95) TaxID=316274 RepID=A9AUI3_HERA2|nr:GAF domain-containing protein [Herpetosiphon sp.]ABX03102.1 anti-sigma-factor antagonist [Herpetosiphon aurantiacus DSM 785]
MSLGSGSQLNNAERTETLQELGLLDVSFDPAFDRLTRLASKVLQAPVSLLSLVEHHRQYFKSHIGLAEPWAERRETPLTHSFCQHVVSNGQELIVTDAREHPLVHDNLAIPDLGVISYAGMPIRSGGHVLGSFCVIDGKPRVWTADELDILHEFAELLMTELKLRQEIRIHQQDIRERERLQNELIGLQQALLDELSTPLIPLNDQVLVVPLIGALDQQRAQRMTEALLTGVGKYRADFVILDITGVPVLDTYVASLLVQTSQAIQLLGARMVLTGLRPEIAQTIVSVGLDLRSVVTYSTLQQGIEYTFRRK